MTAKIRIGSRPSALALAQAAMVAGRIRAAAPGLACEIVRISTTGDKITSAALAQIGGKGLFIRELEQALAAGRIDLAVHSMKDLPAMTAAGFRIVAVPARENPRDALLARGAGGWDALARGARLGTASPRRRLMALSARPDLQIAPLRGNVDTRLGKLAAGEFDAIILAMAGLARLGRLEQIRGGGAIILSELDEREFVPAGGQGALALEAFGDGPIAGAAEIEAAVAALDDPRARAETIAERAFLAAIGASCVSPVGVRAKAGGDAITLRARLFSLDGARSLEESAEARWSPGDTAAAADLGAAAGQRIIARGGRELIDGAQARRDAAGRKP